MKKINAILPILVAATLIVSCDKIEGPTREVVTAGVVIGENAILIDGDTIQFTEDTSTPVQRVMVEDYTGHLCGNCPPAGVMLNDSMRALFGDRLVAVSVHSGQFADVCPTALDCPSAAPVGAFTADYRSTVGDIWAAKFLVNANPIGLIDRVGYPTAHKKTYLNWKTAAQNELTNSPAAKLNISLKYDETTRKIKAGVKTEMIQSYTDYLKVQMIIVEDSIVDWQQWYGHTPQLVPDYLFHDILRASMNGNFGDSLSVTIPMNAGAKFINGYFTTIASGWNPDKCKVVAFVFDANTYRIIQVEEKKIK